MGWRYVSFRFLYEIKRKTGILKNRFPTNLKLETYITLDQWKTISKPFFFQSREDLVLEKNPTTELKTAAENILEGKIQFFSYQMYDLGETYDWLTNPDSGYKYDISKHWTEVEDYNKEAGDIKYVWEKSRFSFIYTIIRYDYHFNEDHSDFIFKEVEDWMFANPINMGPNYKCSQEISLRILNWIFALYFYKHSKYLTEELFRKILHSIYWQLHHVYQNINFSRIAVRNNHAITETLALHLVSMLFPQFPNAEKWAKKGKKWFEKEVEYQIYKDGTFLQFSMNYHRVVVQLLTWAIRITDLNKNKYNSIVYDRAYKSVNFLYQCQEDSNGFLPNYGSNDGALFFKLSNNNYRDYKPQLDALHFILTGESLYKNQIFEDRSWYGDGTNLKHEAIKRQFGLIEFNVGGYYLIRESQTFTFIRCGNHKDRPAHADNLHIDVWYKGQNVLVDGGTYKYNTDDENLKLFMGTASHNTVMLDNNDQMFKGSRFIWYNWTQALDINCSEDDFFFYFKGRVACFRYLGENIIHERIVSKSKNESKWEINDIIHNKPSEFNMNQHWNTPCLEKISINSTDICTKKKSWYSSYYGQKEEIDQFCIESSKNEMRTIISIKE